MQMVKDSPPTCYAGSLRIFEKIAVPTTRFSPPLVRTGRALVGSLDSLCHDRHCPLNEQPRKTDKELLLYG